MRKLLPVILCLLMVLTPGCSSAEKPDIPDTPAGISYKDAVISYLGPEGTYTQEACEKYFAGEGTLDPYETVADAVGALTEGKSDYAVIPQENTIGGAVTDYVDTLIATSEVSVTGEVVLTINQNLLVMPGTSLSSIKTVYSHKQGIAQAKQWLSENLPDAEVTEVSSTAEGARMVSEGKDPSCAAIASAGCADVYGLEVLASGIQNNDKNRTRFYVLSTGEPSSTDSDRIAFVVSGPASELPGLLADIDRCKATLVAIHDRPLKTELGQYNYLIECEGLSYSDYLKITKDSKFGSRFLGCFRVI